MLNGNQQIALIAHIVYSNSTGERKLRIIKLSNSFEERVNNRKFDRFQAIYLPNFDCRNLIRYEINIALDAFREILIGDLSIVRQFYHQTRTN